MDADPVKSVQQPAATASPKFEAAEYVPPSAKHWPTLPGLAAAGILFAIGFVLLAKVRKISRDPKAGAALVKISAPTRMLAAVATLIAAYHICAWSLDERVLPARVPVERGWLVPVLGLLAIGASCAVDLVQRKLDSREQAK